MIKSEPNIFLAFFAGVVTFFAPCTLPLLPAYLGIVFGSAESVTNKNILVKKTAAFIGGFSTVFLGFGAIAGLLGASLFSYRELLSRTGGVVIILFALSLLGFLRLPIFQTSLKFSLPSWARAGSVSGLFVLGMAFGLGWSPCLGPILGSILVLAATSGTALHGMVLLGFYTLGLSVPFLLFAVGLGRMMLFSARFQSFIKILSVLGGVVLLLLGILLFFDQWGYVIGFTARVFSFLNIEALQDYM